MKKKSNKKEQTPAFSPIVYEKKPKKNRALLIIISAFLALLVLFGGTLITITAVKNSRYVASYDGFGLDEKTANYFASFYKGVFLKGTGFEDTPEFWASCPDGDTKTYGEYLSEGYERFIRELLVGNALYSSAATFGKEAKAAVRESVSMVVDGEEFRGRVEAFNEAVSKYGFDYDSFEAAAELYYRYLHAASSIYGSAGQFVSAAEMNEYFETYTYAEIIFINDERLSDSSVRSAVDKLSEAVRIFRESNGTAAGSVTEDMFNGYKQYNTILKDKLVECGYYLNVNSEFTVSLGDESGASFIHDAFESALTMSLGDFSEIDYDGGVCFIYKKPLTSGAYADSAYEQFFTDFAADTASYSYGRLLSSLTDEVNIKDSFFSVDIISIPYNSYYRTDF